MCLGGLKSLFVCNNWKLFQSQLDFHWLCLWNHIKQKKGSFTSIVAQEAQINVYWNAAEKTISALSAQLPSFLRTRSSKSLFTLELIFSQNQDDSPIEFKPRTCRLQNLSGQIYRMHFTWSEYMILFHFFTLNKGTFTAALVKRGRYRACTSAHGMWNCMNHVTV